MGFYQYTDPQTIELNAQHMALKETYAICWERWVQEKDNEQKEAHKQMLNTIEKQNQIIIDEIERLQEIELNLFLKQQQS